MMMQAITSSEASVCTLERVQYPQIVGVGLASVLGEVHRAGLDQMHRSQEIFFFMFMTRPSALWSAIHRSIRPIPSLLSS